MTTEISPARKPPQVSTRHIVVDSRFAALLEEDFGIPAPTILTALEGEPQKAAIAICEWASRQGNPARALTSWAKKHGKGRCRRARIPGSPSRRHAEVSRNPQEDRRDTRRGIDTRRHESGCSLRGVVVNADALDRLAQRLGV